MRKPGLVFILFLGAVSTFAQTKTLVGFNSGATLSSAYMQHSIIPVFMEINWLPGFHAGVQVTHFPEKFDSRVNAAIQIGLNYSQKGWVQVFKDTGVPNHRTRINYLELPIEAVGYFGNRNKYYISLGLFLDYAISAKVDEIPSEAQVNPTYKRMFQIENSDFYPYRLGKDHRLGYGPRGAIGVFRETELGVFRIEAFASFSVRSVFDFEPIESAIPDLSLRYSVGVTIGYYFSLGKLEI